MKVVINFYMFKFLKKIHLDKFFKLKKFKKNLNNFFMKQNTKYKYHKHNYTKRYNKYI